jgi:hypothetical protein
MHASEIVHAAKRLPSRGVERYWTISKCRLDRWGRRLRGVGQEAFVSASLSAQHQALAEEILASEVLTRVWTATMTAHDQHHALDEAEPLARSIYLGHQEARNRVLRWLVHGPHLSLRQLDSLNTLRRRMERWTDSLLAHLAPLIDISPWVFDHERAADFTQDLADNPHNSQHCVQIVRTSLREAVLADAQAHSPNGDLNQQIASIVVACLPPTCVAACDLPLALWLERLGGVADETQQLLDELYSLEGARYEWRP